MLTPEANDALRWLAEQGVTPLGKGRWLESTSAGDLYEAVATVPELRLALFNGLRASYHDVYGDLEPVPALALLDRLQLPADTPHLVPLRAVLAAGARNHYRQPHLWDTVRPE